MRVDVFQASFMDDLLSAVGEREEWLDGALCAQTDPEVFFPDKGGSVQQAKAVCGRCTVRAECLAYALEHDERYGVFGGMSVREREKILGRRVA